MEKYREICSGKIIEPKTEYLRKAYQRQPSRYEKLAPEPEASVEIAESETLSEPSFDTKPTNARKNKHKGG